ncbi:aspartyl/asparaginyl beta-hydroxylase isoform X9 [Aythya fuligula]|uniref:Aspartyl/asparaginyl beta-hydroxylase isoform X9 n=1 Tax=Aythya fuligula TaxID=219594 RepID=A0A6J3CDQ5_AYTFU|nr:aspartyl/asparaginyl beta-hydroxylase isoform X9 [Aythya fuligula]
MLSNIMQRIEFMGIMMKNMNQNMKRRLRLKIQLLRTFLRKYMKLQSKMKLLKIWKLIKRCQKVNIQKITWPLKQRNQKSLFKLRIIQMIIQWEKVKKRLNKTKQKKLKRKRSQSS